MQCTRSATRAWPGLPALAPLVLALGAFGGGDTVPDAFTFADPIDQPLAAVVVSNSISVAGIDTPSPISIAGNDGEFSVNAGPYTNVAGTVVAGDVVRLRQTSSASYATAVDTTLTIGGVAETFSATTFPDTTPDDIASSERDDADLDKTYTSHPFVVTGLGAPAPIYIAAGSDGSARFSIDGGSFSGAAGTIDNGQSVRLRVDSDTSTCSHTYARIGIGGLSGVEHVNFDVYTTCGGALPGCFIATAAYGSPLAREVGTLRMFRDRILQRSWAGRLFVKTYYCLSPPLADAIRDRPWARAIVRAALAPLLSICRSALARGK